jgi:protein farnesyltransferase/geranylgeranyltransferase type-1 subunit alpha
VATTPRIIRFGTIYHRRTLLEQHSENQLPEFLNAKLDYIAGVLEADSKNYHAWSHRQWIILTVNEEDSWKNEVEYGMCFY